jgi:MarR family transcriptional repressor of emrRAB
MNNSFAPTEQRLAVTCKRYPRFPMGPGKLARLIMIYGSESGTMLPSELAEAAGEKSANITRLTNELCEKGLIVRASSAEDRRKVELSLTAAGLALINRFLPDICGLLERQGRDLSAAEQKQLEKLLKKMLNGLSA